MVHGLILPGWLSICPLCRNLLVIQAASTTRGVANGVYRRLFAHPHLALLLISVQGSDYEGDRGTASGCRVERLRNREDVEDTRDKFSTAESCSPVLLYTTI